MFILILLAVIWLSVAAVHHALRQRQPWQLLRGDRKRVQLIRGLEGVRHGLTALYWLLSVVALVELVLFLQKQALHPLLLVVVVAAAVAEIVARTSFVQTQVLFLVYTVSVKYGKYLGFVASFLRLLEAGAKKILHDLPVYRDTEELSHLVQHHHYVHKILDKTKEKQVETLLEVDSKTIQSRIIPLKEVQMVKAEDTMGPMVLTELHDSPYGSFPVYSKRRAKIVGVLDQGVAVSHASNNAKVSSIMEERVVHLPHNATIATALQTFIETSSPISVIIDDEKEPVGILYIQDILRDLFEKTEESQ